MSDEPVYCQHCGKLWAMCSNVRMVEVQEEDIEGRHQPVLATSE